MTEMSVLSGLIGQLSYGNSYLGCKSKRSNFYAFSQFLPPSPFSFSLLTLLTAVIPATDLSEQVCVCVCVCVFQVTVMNTLRSQWLELKPRELET